MNPLLVDRACTVLLGIEFHVNTCVTMSQLEVAALRGLMYMHTGDCRSSISGVVVVASMQGASYHSSTQEP